MKPTSNVQAFPLQWPPGRPRKKNHVRANFHRKESFTHSDGTTAGWKRKASLTFADSRTKMLNELQRLGASMVVISSNVELRNDGLPMSGRREPTDPGVAVYFQLKGQPHSLSCDAWDRVADNLAAISKHVEAMRGQLRWGVADVAAMFSGFRSLPGPIVTPPPMTIDEAAAFVILNASGHGSLRTLVASHEAFSNAYREAARKLHPDANGGQERQDWHTLQTAADVLKKHHGI